MATFEPRDPNYRARIEQSFARQAFLRLLGSTVHHIEPGRVQIALPYKPELAQHHGYVNAGAQTSIADVAAGYAAMTLAAPGYSVLTTEYKMNFLRPAGQGGLIATAQVIKPGRTLNVVHADVHEQSAAGDVHVVTGLVTIMFVEGSE